MRKKSLSVLRLLWRAHQSWTSSVMLSLTRRALLRCTPLSHQAYTQRTLLCLDTRSQRAISTTWERSHPSLTTPMPTTTAMTMQMSTSSERMTLIVFTISSTLSTMTTTGKLTWIGTITTHTMLGMMIMTGKAIIWRTGMILIGTWTSKMIGIMIGTWTSMMILILIGTWTSMKNYGMKLTTLAPTLRCAQVKAENACALEQCTMAFHIHSMT